MHVFANPFTHIKNTLVNKNPDFTASYNLFIKLTDLAIIGLIKSMINIGSSLHNYYSMV